MNHPPDQDQDTHVIPFPQRHRAMTERETYFDHLERELREAIREAFATAQDDPMNEQDRLAIADERAFKARFGFDRPRRYRENLIRMKHTLDLTDKEIRLLKITGSLPFDARGARLAASRLMAIYGRVLIVLLGLLMAYAWLLAGAHRPPFTPTVAWKLMGVMAVLNGLGWIVHQFYIRPWDIQQRTRARRPLE